MAKRYPPKLKFQVVLEGALLGVVEAGQADPGEWVLDEPRVLDRFVAALASSVLAEIEAPQGGVDLVEQRMELVPPLQAGDRRQACPSTEQLLSNVGSGRSSRFPVGRCS